MVENQCLPFPISGSNKPMLTLSLSLQATCPRQLRPLDSVPLCHPCPPFHCPHRQSCCPSRLSLAWLPTTARPVMKEGVQDGKKMGWGVSNAGLPKHIIAPSSFLHLFLTHGPYLVLPCCPSIVLPVLRAWRSHAYPLLTVALKGLHLAVIKTFFNLQ